MSDTLELSPHDNLQHVFNTSYTHFVFKKGATYTWPTNLIVKRGNITIDFNGGTLVSGAKYDGLGNSGNALVFMPDLAQVSAPFDPAFHKGGIAYCQPGEKGSVGYLEQYRGGSVLPEVFKELAPCCVEPSESLYQPEAYNHWKRLSCSMSGIVLVDPVIVSNPDGDTAISLRYCVEPVINGLSVPQPSRAALENSTLSFVGCRDALVDGSKDVPLIGVNSTTYARFLRMNGSTLIEFEEGSSFNEVQDSTLKGVRFNDLTCLGNSIINNRFKGLNPIWQGSIAVFEALGTLIRRNVCDDAIWCYGPGNAFLENVAPSYAGFDPKYGGNVIPGAA